MLAMIWVMFALSTAHWAVNVAFLVAKVKAMVVVNGSIRATSDLMNAIVTINVSAARPTLFSWHRGFFLTWFNPVLDRGCCRSLASMGRV